MIRKLPHWVLIEKFPAFHDLESLTAVEQTARVYGKMNELIESYNKFISDINLVIEEFDLEKDKNVKDFICRFSCLVDNYINTVDMRIAHQDRAIAEVYEKFSTDVINTFKLFVSELYSSGELDNAVYESIENLHKKVDSYIKQIELEKEEFKREITAEKEAFKSEVTAEIDRKFSEKVEEIEQSANNYTDESIEESEMLLQRYADEDIKLYVLDSRRDYVGTNAGATQDICLMQIKVDGEIKNMLIDMGDSELADSHIKLIRQLGVTKIDYVYLTHYHSDHAGIFTVFKARYDDGRATVDGFAEEKLDFRGGTIFMPTKKIEGNAIKTKVTEVANLFGMTKIIPSTDTYDYDIGSLNLHFVNCITTDEEYNLNNDIQYTDSQRENNTSMCCIMTFGNTKIGFFGDIHERTMIKLNNQILWDQLDLMNVVHHGIGDEKQATCLVSLYEAIKPKMCYTQDGMGHRKEGNRHILTEDSSIHPYLLENNIPNYAVSRNGTMLFNISKNGVTTTAKSDKDFEVDKPIGNVFVANKGEMNPNYLFGGTWNLQDKFFKSQRWSKEFDKSIESSDYFTNSSLAVTNLRAFYNGHDITFSITGTTKNSVGESTKTLFFLNPEKFGIKKSDSLMYQIVGIATSDAGNTLLMLEIFYDNDEDKWKVQCTDVTGETLAADVRVRMTFAVHFDKAFMLDSACDKFYWERTQ